MSDRKIEEATPDVDVTGEEKLPVSDGGVAKHMTAEQLRDFAISALGDAPVVPSTDLQNDSVYIERSGETKRLNGAVLADAIIANALAKTGIVEPNGNEKFVIDDSGTEKTMTLSQMKSYIAGNIGDIFAGAGSALPLGASDLMLVSQGGTGAKATLGSLSSFVLGGFASFLASCVSVLNLQDTDKICVLSGGVTKTVTVRELRALTGGDVIGPTTTTDGKIPQWDSTQKKLKDGLTLRTEIRATGTADNQSIPTEAAVRAAIHSTVEGGYAKISGTPTAGKIPLWHDGESIEDGKSVATSVRSTGSSDDAIPTEKAVREALDEKIDAPSSAPSDGSVPRWNEGGLDASLDVKETVRTSALASHGAIATEKAVRTALDEKADSSIVARVASVEASVAGKASSADLTSLAQTVNGKASQSALEALAESVAQKGNVESSGQKTAGSLAAWNAAGKLVDGKAVSTEIPSSGASDDAVPTEKAVKDLFDTFDGASAPDTVTAGNIPQWNQDKSLSDGLGVRNSVRDAANASNLHVPTEKAVRDAVDQLVKGPQSHTEDAIPQWGATNELKPGKSVVTTLPTNATDAQIPTAKAVRDALPTNATTSKAGLMAATDKAKLDRLVDMTAVEEVGGALSDNDTIPIKKADTLQKKTLLSRIWTYILNKLPTVPLDTFSATTDNVNLNATADAHGLLPKLSGNPLNFLSGAGEWAIPPGSDDFTGTDGTSDGVHGLVPAPTAADANKFLNADGTWATPPSAAGVDIPGATASEGLADADLAYFFVPSASGYRKATMAQIRELVMGTKRYDTVFVPAGAMTPSNTDGATPGVITFENVTHDTMAFPNTANKKAEFSVVFPDDWDKGAVKAKLLWTVYDSTKAEAGQHVGFKVGAVSAADGDNITVAPTTFVDLNDQVDSANELHRSAASAELEFDGVHGDGNLVHFVLNRDTAYAPPGGSPMPTEAIVLGVIIQYGRTASYEQW